MLEINGSQFTLADLERLRPTILFQARSKFFDAEKSAIESFIDSYLLENQAKKESTTVDALLEKHINSAIAKDPSEEALRVFYEGVDTTESFEAVRDRILLTIRERRKQKAKDAYLKQLRAEAKTVVRLSQPRTPAVLNDTPVSGALDAPVVLMEFADYECPFCQQVQPVIDQLRKEYPGKITLAWKDAPLPMHPNAQKAAEAAHCAGAQGKFWEFHALLFSSKQFDVAGLRKSAETLKLDPAAFSKCLESSEQARIVKSQLTEFEGLGLQGTPSFFINGRFFSGVMTYEQLRGVVEEEIALSTMVKSQAAQPGNAHN